MNGTWLWLVVAVIAVVWFVPRLFFVSAESARAHLQQGAVLVDVRTPEEYRGGHLPNAINIALEELTARLPARVPDRNQAVLLYCLSGARSGLARRQLKQLGYANVFNLGSYPRARRIVTASTR